METQWANPKEGDEAFFSSRADVVEFLDRYVLCSVLIMSYVTLFVTFCYDNLNTNMNNFNYCYLCNYYELHKII